MATGKIIIEEIETITPADVGLGNVTNNAQLTIANNLSDVANVATSRLNLGLQIGADVQAWSSNLDSINQNLSTTDDVVFNNISPTGLVDGRDVANDGTTLDTLNSLVVTPNIEQITITSNGQTAFTISSTPASALNDSILILNGVSYFQALGDFSVTGTNLTWNNPDGVTIQTTDSLVYVYNTPTFASPVKYKEIAGVDYNSDFNSTVRARNIGGSGNFDFTFRIPDDANEILAIDIKFGVSNGAAGPGKDIDLISTYALDNEPYNQNSESDLATVYDFTGKADRYDSISLLPVLQNAQAGHNVAINIDHNGINGSLFYTLIIIKYT